MLLSNQIKNFFYVQGGHNMKLIIATMIVYGHICVAQTQEIENAKRRYHEQEFITQRALQRYQQDKQQQDRQEQHLRGIQNHIQILETRLSSVDRDIANLQSRIRQYEMDIPRLEREMNTVNNEKSQLLSVRSRLDYDQTDLHRRNDDLTRRIQSLNQQLDQARQNNETTAEQRLLAERQPLLDERDRVQSQLQSTIQQLRQNRSQLEQANARLTRVQQEHQQAGREISNLRAQIVSIESSRGQWQSELQSLRNSENEASIRLRELSNIAMSSAAMYQTEYQLAQTIYQEYRRLLEEYEQRKAEIEQLALSQAEADSRREADQKARIEAATQAETQAKNAAQRKAQTDISLRDFVKGYEQGFQDQGQSPDLTDSYTRSYASGEAVATQKAESEIFPQHFNQSINGLKSAEPSSERVLKDAELDESFDGGSTLDLATLIKEVASVNAPRIEKPNTPDLKAPTTQSAPASSMRHERLFYQPQCSHLQNELAQLCLDAYDRGYTRGFTRSYTELFRSHYIQLFNQISEQSYLQLLASGDDQSELSRGRLEGAKNAGRVNGYEKSIQEKSRIAADRAQNEFLSDRNSSFMIRLHSLQLIDSNGDGLMSSGESVRFQMVLDNLGGTSPEQGLLIFTLKNSQSLEEISHTQRTLPELKGDTRTTLDGLFTAKVAQGSHNLSDLKVDVELVREDTKEVIASLRFAQPIRFPVDLYNIFGRLQVQNYTEVLLSFRNNLDSPSEEQSLSITDTLGILEVAEEVTLPALAPNETTTLALSMRLKQKPVTGTTLTMVVGYENGITQHLDADAILARDAKIRLYTQPGSELTQDTIKVRANQEFNILGSMEYLSTSPQIGPISLRISNRTAGVRLPNNSTVGVNWGTVSKNRTVNPTRFRFIASPQTERQSISFQLLKGTEVIDTKTVYLEF
jgi:hypothetical protein